MTQFNLNRIVKHYDLDLKTLASALFPNNAHPAPALNRIIRNEATLNADQLKLLATICGASIDSFFTDNWTAGTKEKKVYIFSKGPYRAQLNFETWTSKIFFNGNLQHEEILMREAITLSEYLNFLDNIINKQ